MIKRLRPGAAYLGQGQSQQSVVSQGRGHGGHGGRGPGALVSRLWRLQMRGQTEAQESPGSQAGGQGTNILWADKIVSDYVFYALGVIRVPSGQD